MVLRELRVCAALRGRAHIARLVTFTLKGGSKGNPLVCYLQYDRATTDMQRLVNSGLKRSAHFGTAAARRAAATQLLCALDEMHGHGVAHRDLKPANILCVLPEAVGSGARTEQSPASGGGVAPTTAAVKLQLCDFGSARAIGCSAPRRSGTLWYRPPEVVVAAGGSTSGGSCVVLPSHDLWALGATLTELLSGKPLLAANDEAHWVTLHAGLAGSGGGRVPRGAAKDEAALLAALLSDNPAARADISAVRHHLACTAGSDDDGEAEASVPVSVADAEEDTGTSSSEARRCTVVLDDVEAAESAEAILRLLKAEVGARPPADGASCM